MKSHSRKFESVVQLGLFVIIFILLFLVICSNYVIYNLWEATRNQPQQELKSICLTISRQLQNTPHGVFNDSLSNIFKARYGLQSVALVGSASPPKERKLQQKWLAEVLGDMPPSQASSLARLFLESEPNRLIRGESNHYYYLYPFQTRYGTATLAVSRELPVMAYLDKAGRVILILDIGALLAIIGLYVLLSRFILSPFRRIQRQAIDAGRKVEAIDDDVEAMVSDHRKIIEELKEKEEQLLVLNEAARARADRFEQFNRYLLSSIDSGLITVDKEGTVSNVNDAASRILGIDRQRFIGGDYHRLNEISPEIVKRLQLAVDHNKNQAYQEVICQTEEGTSLMLGITVSVIFDDRKKTVGVGLLINDLSELKKLRRELETSHQLSTMGEMAAGLAHQLRNSLGALIGYGRLTRKKLARKEEVNDCLAAMEAETGEAEALIDRFLNFARPFNFDPRLISLNQLLLDIVESFNVRDDRDHVDVEYRTGIDCKLPADRLLLKQALTNIVENAIIAYDGRPGKVMLEVLFESEEARIQISDKAGGIAPDDLQKIFTPFFSTIPSGTGLGLPLASKIIDLHHGRISVESNPPDGTVFTISLPLESDQSRAGSRPEKVLSR